MAGRQIYLLIFLVLIPRLKLRILAGYFTEKIKFNGWLWYSYFVCGHFYIDSALVADICQAEAVGTIVISFYVYLIIFWLLFLTPNHNIFLTGWL
jgi:hypothetical protein